MSSRAVKTMHRKNIQANRIICKRCEMVGSYMNFVLERLSRKEAVEQYKKEKRAARDLFQSDAAFPEIEISDWA